MMGTDPFYGRSLFCLLVLVVFSGRVFFAWAGAADGSLQMTVESEGLTVSAKAVPLTKVLQEVARKTAVPIKGRLPATDERITLEFHDLTIEEGIERILEGYSYAFVFSEEKEGDLSSPRRLSEVWIFSKSERVFSLPEREVDERPEPVSFSDPEEVMEDPLIEEDSLHPENGEGDPPPTQSSLPSEEAAIVEELPQEITQKAISQIEAGEIPEVDDLAEMPEVSAASAAELEELQEIEEKEGPF
jgi:hypothetical protein